MFTFNEKKWELLDYATTMWDAIGAMYENVYLEFPVKAALLPIVLNAKYFCPFSDVEKRTFTSLLGSDIGRF